MNNQFAAAGLAAETQKSTQFSTGLSLNDNEESSNIAGNNSGIKPLLPKAFKFGQVDQKMLMSRLYSTPFKKENSPQQYALEMGGTSVHKPRIKKIEQLPPQAEPIVISLVHYYLGLVDRLKIG